MVLELTRRMMKTVCPRPFSRTYSRHLLRCGLFRNYKCCRETSDEAIGVAARHTGQCVHTRRHDAQEETATRVHGDARKPRFL